MEIDSANDSEPLSDEERRRYWIDQIKKRMAEIDELMEEAKKHGVDLTKPINFG